jgi:hypothetical protein
MIRPHPHLILRRKLILMAVLTILVLVFQASLPGNARLVRFYDMWIFKPWQSFRNVLFGWIPFPIGDILYFVGIVALITAALRWVYFLIRFPTHKHYLGNSLLNTINALALLYLLFFIGWGGNYYKPKLTDYWKLSLPAIHSDEELVTYDSFLVHQLNVLAPRYRPMSFKKADSLSRMEYRCCTDSRTKLRGLLTKPSLFGSFMQYFGIQGYYNPWTGEAQVNRFLPPFMLPFVACHEMAHQSGIAAEDDANLLSYALCTSASDPSFRYSGYFNLWLYTHGRLRHVDSTLALKVETGLNGLTLTHRDTLRAIRHRYDSDAGKWSSTIYDGYLRMHNQKDGIDSYYLVALTAWAYEQRRTKEGMQLLRIP